MIQEPKLQIRGRIPPKVERMDIAVQFVDNPNPFDAKADCVYCGGDKAGTESACGECEQDFKAGYNEQSEGNERTASMSNAWLAGWDAAANHDFEAWNKEVEGEPWI